jgi:hypothetical protein
VVAADEDGQDGRHFLAGVILETKRRGKVFQTSFRAWSPLANFG